MKIVFYSFLLTFVYNYTTVSQPINKLNKEAPKFKIVFVADSRGEAKNPAWLTRIASDWGATGVCIRVFWGDINPTPGIYNWNNLDNSINTITNTTYGGKNLDIYIRVCMGLQKPTWVSPTSFPFTQNDFQIKYDGSLYDHSNYGSGIPESEKYPLNFTSATAIDTMKNFFGKVLQHIYVTYSQSIKDRIKEVIPTFSSSDEEEYPNAEMCGYSEPELMAFRSYLQTIYSSPSVLNQKWNPNNYWDTINSFNSINPRNYKWHLYDNSQYLYPAGRIDWINFRLHQLYSFINSLSIEANSRGFKMGIQLGSIYDGSIEKRGWVDPTKLFEKVNSVHVADIYRYSINFNFAADYLRSIGKFWTITNSLTNNPIRFSTETNWPNYNNKTPSYLSQKWTEQLISYYNKGASEHYLVGWDVPPNSLDNLKTPYNIWRTTLQNYSNDPLVLIQNQNSVHLGCEQVFYNHNSPDYDSPDSVGKFALYKSIVAQFPYLSMTQYNYDGNKDIITNYMVEKNPTYLNNYNTIYFTKSSEYINEETYLRLMKSSVTKPYINATWFSDVGHGEYAFTQGLKNEYGEVRSPIHLIWRSRTDLMAIWPDANLPAPGNGWTIDFVKWAFDQGCGYSNQPTQREYPFWEIRDNLSTGKYTYDKNIRAVWNSNLNNVQATFPGTSPYWAHYSSDPNSNMITWAKANYTSSPLLLGYNNWPYIGDNGTSKNNVETNYTKVPEEYSLSQNYPNPFNPTTTINYSIPDRDFIIIKVYDILGTEIETLVNEFKESGNYSIIFDGNDISSGLYIYTLTSSNSKISQKMLLLK